MAFLVVYYHCDTNEAARDSIAPKVHERNMAYIGDACGRRTLLVSQAYPQSGNRDSDFAAALFVSQQKVIAPDGKLYLRRLR